MNNNAILLNYYIFIVVLLFIFLNIKFAYFTN